jgi:hypothetical protein
MMPAATRSQPPPEQPAPEGMDIDPPPDQNGPLQPNASGAQNTNEPPNSLMQLLDTWIPQNAPLSDRVAVLDKVTKLMEFTKPQVSAFSQVKLPTFSGNDDLHGTVISSAYYLPLIEWLRKCEFSMRTARVPEREFALCLVSHLSGAAHHSFMRQNMSPQIDTWSYTQAKEAILSLIPDYRALFMETAQDMTLKADSLADDIERFALYIQHGETEPDGSKVTFRSLQTKIHSAAPRLLSYALTHHGLTLAFHDNFAECVAAAQSIVAIGTINGILSSAKFQSVSTPKFSPESTGAKPQSNHRRNAQKADNGFRQRLVKKQKTLDNATAAKYSELCKKYQRCTACGWLIDGQRKEVHAATGKCKANLFANRLALVAKLVE